MKKRKILISKNVLIKMENLTTTYQVTENGGFLFGRMNPDWIYVLDVSDAGLNAKRTFSSVQLDNNSLLEIVKDKINMRHFIIGTWHSHPKNHSLYPSKLDQVTMKKINSYYDKIYPPIFIITNISNERFNFVIYRVDEFGNVLEENCYELID